MYALVKIRREQLLMKSISLPIVFIDQENGIIADESHVRNKLKEYPEIDYMEEPFLMELKGETIENEGEVLEGCILFYIGKGIQNQQEWNIYDISQKSIKKTGKNIQRYKIKTNSNYLTSLQYLECILDMLYEAKTKNKKLIIFTEIEIINLNCKYRSLMDKIVNHLLETAQAIIIHRCSEEIKDYYVPTNERFEPYINQAIYTTDDLVVALRKIQKIIQCNISSCMVKKEYRVLSREKKTLYQDIFYKQIKDEEEIYVNLLPTSNLTQEAYEKIGVECINLSGGHGILKGKKFIFDQNVEVLNNEVAPQYTPQILTYSDVRVYDIHNYEKATPRKEQKYNGEGVYIGVIGIEGINYEEEVYFTESGEIKVAYIWEQIQGSYGTEYTKNQLIASSQMNENLPIYTEERLNAENILFKIAGGKISIGEEVYKGIATKAEFIVAKINSAPTRIQEIYGGIPTKRGVLLEDLIIAIDKLVTFATEQNVPLVLAIPFAAGVNSHDGVLTLEEKLGEYAHQTGVTIITSTGEEADKKHHARIELTSNERVKVDLSIQKPNQRVVAGMWIDPFGEKRLTLYNTKNQKEYSLDKEKQYREGEMEILTTGNRVSEYNGLREVIFSLNNPEVSKWEIWIQDQRYKGYISIVDIWLAQYELNPYSFLEPNNTFTTITSLGNVRGVICVGDYDNDTLTTYKTSGRGYTRQKLTKPTFVAQGKEVFEVDGEGKFVAGSLVAMANMVGVIAAVYSKILDEKIERIPSTAGIGSLLVSKVNRLDTVQYPNPSQGNGIFDRNSLYEILDPIEKIKL